MKAGFCSGRIVGSLSTAAIALALGACGGAKQLQARAPEGPRAAPVGMTNAQPPAPNTPTASTVVISDEILRTCNIPDADSYFEFDSAKLTSFDYRTLDQLTTCFTTGPLAGRHLHIVGHADPRGADDYNMTLGQSRADSVQNYLVSHGLAAKQGTTTSRGAMDASGTDETGWAHDRRVDVYLQH